MALRRELESDAAPSSVASSSRLAALVNTGLLDSPIEEAFDRLASLAARTIQAPVSLISLVDRERQFFKSAFGLCEPWLSRRETPLTHSFCKHVVATGQPLLIEDANLHPWVKGNLAIPELKVIAYAGMPLTLRNGQTIGSFCVIDHRPRIWLAAEVQLLRDVAASVMTEIELRLLASAKTELLEVIFHDLKNPLGAILLSSRLLETKNLENRQLARGLRSISGAAERMRDIIQDLSTLNHIEHSTLTLRLADQGVEKVLAQALEKAHSLALEKQLLIRSSFTNAGTFRCDAHHLVNALAKLVAIAIRRSPEGSSVELAVTGGPGTIAVEIRDHGPALTDEDRLHFFDRFVESSSIPTQGAKLSVCLAREIILAHRGTVSLEHSGAGMTVFRVTLPRDRD